MTKEELKQEAEEYAEGMAKYYASTHEDCIPSQFEKYLRNAYISSAEPREKQIAELEQKLEQTEKDLADYQFNYPTIKELQQENADLKEEINKIAFARGNLEEENAELKILVSSMLYEINALWDISEMNEDVRKHAERIDSEVEK